MEADIIIYSQETQQMPRIDQIQRTRQNQPIAFHLPAKLRVEQFGAN